MKLYEHQEVFLSEILNKIKSNNRIVCQLSTGGGKTVVFIELIKRLDKKTLIIVDSIELVHQTANTLSRMGLDTGLILAGNKELPKNKIIVAMVKTLWNRREKMPEFDYCIVDECHVWEFNKLFDFLGSAKIIGFTATPVRLSRKQVHKCKQCNTYYEEKNECCGFETEIGSVKETMSDWYDDIVVGKNIKGLISEGFLVQDKNYVFEFDDSTLKVDGSGEFTSVSLFDTFSTDQYQTSLLEAYETIAKGKKTMIFTSSTALNAIYAELFKDYNVRTYDSVNNKSSEREAIVEWFRTTPEAILINTGCFTKGFDVCDVEAIILARATMSLSLYIQMIGRGARITNKIQKDKIIVIDGGKNIKKHQTFSFDRNWQKIFKDKKYKDRLENIIECTNCGFINLKNECENCGSCNWEPVEIKIKKPGETFEVKKISLYNPPMPKVSLVIKNCKTKLEAMNIYSENFVNFVVRSGATKTQIVKALESGELYKKVIKHTRKGYFEIINSSLDDTARRTWSNFNGRLIDKIKRKYES
jgi:superfamily II DNA or RNA helicase